MGMSNVLLTRKVSSPIGGVISPICMFTTYRTPNHTGSKPSAVIIGTKRGMVSNMMVIASIKQPSIKRMILIAITTSHGDIVPDATKPVKDLTTPDVPMT